MPKVNKIVQYDLGREVLDLKNKGLSQLDIANYLKLNHQDIPDIQDISAMSVNRFLKSDEIKKFETQIVEGDSPEESLRSEFRDKMYSMDDEIHQVLADSKKLVDEAKLILEKAKTSDDLILQISAIKSVNDVLKQNTNSIEQTRRNWSTFVEQAFRQFGNLEQAQKNNYTQYNTFLVDMSKDLCENCRKKIVHDIIDFETKMKEGE